MNYFEILILAIALAMDAFAVSTACGICIKNPRKSQVFRLAISFGVFQALMPLIGFFLGITIKSFIETYAPIISFVLLSIIGAKMIYESFQKEESCDPYKDPTKGLQLLILSVATSLDALAVGLSFSLLNIPIAAPCAIIGITAFIFSCLGFRLGKTFSKSTKLSHIAELFGGFILIAIGVKILIY